jgi:GT2 family glycosyltransferase
MSPLVTVVVLNYKQRAYAVACLDSVLRQTYPSLEIIFIDNGSGDNTAQHIRSRYPAVTVVSNSQNMFFCRAHNQAIRKARGEFILLLNADMVLTDTCAEQLVQAMLLDDRAGMVSGKLLRMGRRLRPLDPAVIDSTGLWFSRQLRHFDRGALDQDRGQFESLEYIFGPSGAAPLYRRTMLDDISFEGEFFDEDFVMYREDADLAWRAQWRGWKCLYTPHAIAHHVRGLGPEHGRKNIDPAINLHSIKNRFLMRIKNQTGMQAARLLLPMLWRDLQVIGYVLCRERTSLPAFALVVKLLPRLLKKRRHIMAGRAVSNSYMAQWFAAAPVSFPARQTRAGNHTNA